MSFKGLSKALLLSGLLALFVILIVVEPQKGSAFSGEVVINKTGAVNSNGMKGVESVLPTLPDDYIWISAERLNALPTFGGAWEEVLAAANAPMAFPNLSDQNDPTNVQVFAKALVYARTGEARYRDEVISACMLAIGTEEGGRALDFGKELISYVLAADLVTLPEEKDARFRLWLEQSLSKKLSGKTLRSTHEVRPNNWGTYAGASRLAVAAYLGDKEEIRRAATVFKGWLGDREAYNGFRFKARDWQADGSRPVGINPVGATINGFSVDGVLPDDQRRAGAFSWPPPKENYVYSALQGAVAQAVILHRLGYPVWDWEEQALLRAFHWLNEVAFYPAVGDDTWMPYIINYYYGSSFVAPVSTKPGKNVGWSAWTHAASG